MCMAENERQRRGERCWSDQKSICVEYNLRKGSNNVGENQRFSKCFQFKALVRRLCKGMQEWKRWTLSRYIERSRTVRENTGNIGMHGSRSKDEAQIKRLRQAVHLSKYPEYYEQQAAVRILLYYYEA